MRTVNVTSEKFRGLVNPYTGEPIQVKMLIPESGRPLFFAPDTFTHAKHYPTVAQALDAWDCENGVTGIKPRSSLRCPYTGEGLTIEHDVAGYWLRGGFDPCRLWSDAEFLYYATMRNGVSKYPKPAQDSRVTAPPETPDEMPESREDPVEPTDEARRVAESVVDQFKDKVGMKGSGTVSMATTKGKRR